MTATRFTVPVDVLASRVGSETVILHLQSGLYFGLNEVGAEMWDLLQQGKPLPEIVGEIVGRFDTDPRTVQSDLDDLVAALVAKELLLPDSN